jgi:low temperature requirement protein LtrA
VTSSPIPRIMRRRGEPEFPTFIELYFDLIYIFLLFQLSRDLADNLTATTAVQTAVLLAAAWWVWVLNAWLTDLFNPRLPVIQATVILVMLGVLAMALMTPRAFGASGWVYVAAYFGIHIVRDAVLIPGTRVNRGIQARSIRVFVWFGFTLPLWAVGAAVEGTPRLVLWSIAVAADLGSARFGWRTPFLGRTDLASPIFTGAHLSERHWQIFIVSLGELILTAGLGLARSGFEAGRVAACATAFANAVLLYQLYFHRVWRLLAPSSGVLVQRIRPGTSTSYAHLVMVAGIVVISAGDLLVIGRPFGEVPVGWTVTLLGGPALFLLGSCLFDFVVAGRILLSRVVAIALLGAGGPAMSLLPPLGVILVANLILLLTLVDEVVGRRWRFADSLVDTG